MEVYGGGGGMDLVNQFGSFSQLIDKRLSKKIMGSMALAQKTMKIKL